MRKAQITNQWRHLLKLTFRRVNWMKFFIWLSSHSSLPARLAKIEFGGSVVRSQSRALGLPVHRGVPTWNGLITDVLSHVLRDLCWFLNSVSELSQLLSFQWCGSASGSVIFWWKWMGRARYGLSSGASRRSSWNGRPASSSSRWLYAWIVYTVGI